MISTTESKKQTEKIRYRLGNVEIFITDREGNSYWQQIKAKGLKKMLRELYPQGCLLCQKKLTDENHKPLNDFVTICSECYEKKLKERPINLHLRDKIIADNEHQKIISIIGLELKELDEDSKKDGWIESEYYKRYKGALEQMKELLEEVKK